MTAAWHHAARHWGQSAAGVAVLLAADHAFSQACAAGGIEFPAALLAMFMLVGAMLAACKLGCEEAAEAAHGAFKPALQFINSWMPLFYSPLLVTLPQNASSLIGPQLPRIALLLVGGVAASIVFTGRAVLLLTRLRAAKAEELPQQAAKPAANFKQAGQAARPAPPPPPLPPPELSMSTVAACWGALGCAILAVICVLPRDSGRHSQLAAALMLAATTYGFAAGSALPEKVQKWCHPVVVCGLVANAAGWLLGAVTDRTHDSVMRAYISEGGGGRPLLQFLGVIVLSFGFRLFEQRRLIGAHAAEILGGVTLSVLFSLFGTALAGRLLGIDSDAVRALVPRGVTAALALPIADGLGASRPVTAAAVTCTGMLGAGLVRPLLDLSRCNRPLARGIAAAASAHGMATATIGSAEPDALPFAALGYALTGITATMICALPPVRSALLVIIG